MSETAQLADVVLPAASWLEKSGTFTATDRRVQPIRQAIAPRGDARPDWWIVAALARRLAQALGRQSDAPHAGWNYAGPDEILREAAALTPIYGGITPERLAAMGFLQWPCPSAEHPGTPYLHKGRFSRGLGAFTPVEYRPAAELTDEDYPLILSTGRSLFHYHTGTMTRRTPKLDQEVPQNYVEIHPVDAERLGVSKSGWVRVSSRRGALEAKAWITRRVPPGVVFIPFHFAESAANALTIAEVDPKSGIPELKICAVRVEALEPAEAQEATLLADAAPAPAGEA